MQFLIGSDPELFVMKGEEYLSAHGMIPGDKKNPHLVTDGAVQVDGMALEFNTNPAENEEQWVYNLSSVMAELCAMVPEFEVVAHPVAKFTPEYMEQQPEEALELGCDPDFNAWHDGAEYTKPNACLPMRTGAGHVHIGWTKDANLGDAGHVLMCHQLVRQLDFYLGLPSLLFDDNVERRSMYGKAGCHRVKTYGVEYRVLSNKWVGDEHLQRWVFRATHEAINQLLKGNDLAKKWGNIENIINNSDVERALTIIEEEGIEVV